MNTPQGWHTGTLHDVADITMGQSPDSKYYSEEEIGLPFLQGCAEFQARFPLPRLYCSNSKKIAKQGAILFSVRAPVGRQNIAERDYVIGRGLAAIQGKRVAQPYLEHFLASETPKFSTASQGSTFEAINSTELASWPVIYPDDHAEQSKIAEVLSTVDRTIAQTEALIAKQQRIKAGLMQDLLTRGIDQHGQLRSEDTHAFKDSSLGRIPVEWDVCEVRGLCQLGRGRVISSREIEANPGIYPVYSSQSKDGGLMGRLATFDFEGEYVTWTTDGAYAGTIFHRNGQFNCTNVCGTLHAKKRLSMTFLAYQLATVSKQYVSYVGNPKLMNGVMGHILLALPKSYKEQSEIAKCLDDQDAEILRIQLQKKKFQSLKAALMQDLLTGKVRVTPLLQPAEAASHG